MKNKIIIKWSSIVIYVVSCVTFLFGSWVNFSDEIKEEYISKNNYSNIETDSNISFFDTIIFDSKIKSGKISILDSGSVINIINDNKYVNLPSADGISEFCDLYVGVTLFIFVFIFIMHIGNSKLIGILPLVDMLVWFLFAFMYKANLTKCMYKVNNSFSGEVVSVSGFLILPIILMIISCSLWLVYKYQNKKAVVNKKEWICFVCKNKNEGYANFCSKCGYRKNDIRMEEMDKGTKESTKDKIIVETWKEAREEVKDDINEEKKRKIKYSGKVGFSKDTGKENQDNIKKDKNISVINIMNNNSKDIFTINCPACYVENNKNAEFCIVCGAKLKN